MPRKQTPTRRSAAADKKTLSSTKKVAKPLSANTAILEKNFGGEDETQQSDCNEDYCSVCDGEPQIIAIS